MDGPYGPTCTVLCVMHQKQQMRGKRKRPHLKEKARASSVVLEHVTCSREVQDPWTSSSRNGANFLFFFLLPFCVRQWFCLAKNLFQEVRK